MKKNILKEKNKKLRQQIGELKKIINPIVNIITKKTEWLYIIERISKNTKISYKNYKWISRKDVNIMWRLLRMLTNEANPTTNYRQVVSALIVKHKMKVNIDAFNGGRNRNKFMFPKYYYPLKILHELGYINYNKSDIITRLVFTRKQSI